MSMCMKRHLTECRNHTHKKFGLDTIFFSFFFERVPNINLREMVWGHVASFLAVTRCEALLPRQGRGRTIEAFDEKFFHLWARQIPMIED
jgi:hypothetical protein